MYGSQLVLISLSCTQYSQLSLLITSFLFNLRYIFYRNADSIPGFNIQNQTNIVERSFRTKFLQSPFCYSTRRKHLGGNDSLRDRSEQGTNSNVCVSLLAATGVSTFPFILRANNRLTSHPIDTVQLFEHCRFITKMFPMIEKQNGGRPQSPFYIYAFDLPFPALVYPIF